MPYISRPRAASQSRPRTIVDDQGSSAGHYALGSDAPRSNPFAAKGRVAAAAHRAVSPAGYCGRDPGASDPRRRRVSNEQILERARNIVTGLLGNYRIRALEARDIRVPRLPISQMDLLDQLERRAEARNNGRSGRA